MRSARNYARSSRIAITRNAWDRDFHLEKVLEIAEILATRKSPDMVKEVLEIYEEIQGYRYTGPDVDERERQREAQRRRRNKDDSPLKSNS